MAVFSRDEILKLIEKRQLKISPFDKSQVGPGSIDLRLSNVFRVFNVEAKAIDIRDDTDYKSITRVVRLKKSGRLLMNPGQLIHGITMEKISLPDNISGRIEGRSRFARLGLLTHVSSGFMQPGVSGRIVLEMANLSPFTIAVHPGTRVCQIILESVKGRAKYSGKFSGQTAP